MKLEEAIEALEPMVKAFKDPTYANFRQPGHMIPISIKTWEAMTVLFDKCTYPVEKE